MRGNKKTVALSEEQYKNIINTIFNGGQGFRGSKKIATALVLEANLGIRISDILKLKLSDIIKDGERYRLDIVEQKTQKKREFTVPQEIYLYIKNYCYDNKIESDEFLFPSSSTRKDIPLNTQTVQRMLRIVCDYLGYNDLDISSHSFRKFFATRVYQNSGYNVVLVQTLLQHSSPEVTQRYIGIGTKQVEEALKNNTFLI